MEKKGEVFLMNACFSRQPLPEQFLYIAIPAFPELIRLLILSIFCFSCLNNCSFIFQGLNAVMFPFCKSSIMEHTT